MYLPCNYELAIAICKVVTKRLTGGISFGNSTALVIEMMPFSIGHSRSTFWICSQRSASVFTSRIKPYLTCSWTYAPSSIVSCTVPTALMISSEPLETAYQLVEIRRNS